MLWSRRAADLAIGRYEIDQGLALLHRALSLETDPQEQAAIWQRIGQACALKYDGQGFYQAMQKALDLGSPCRRGLRRPGLADEPAGRDGVQQPDMTLVDGWIQRPWTSPRRAAHPGHALAALSYSDDDPLRNPPGTPPWRSANGGRPGWLHDAE